MLNQNESLRVVRRRNRLTLAGVVAVFAFVAVSITLLMSKAREHMTSAAPTIKSNEPLVEWLQGKQFPGAFDKLANAGDGFRIIADIVSPELGIAAIVFMALVTAIIMIARSQMWRS